MEAFFVFGSVSFIYTYFLSFLNELDVSRSFKINTLKNVESYFFKLLLVIVFWAPIPLASNRPWAWGLLEILCYLTFLGCIWSHKNTLKERLYSHLVPILCISLFVLWNLVQIIPLPSGLVSILSPNALKLYTQGQLAYSFIPISIDAGQSLVSLYKGVAYWCLFISVLLLCSNDSRIKTLMLCIIASGIFQATYGVFEILSGATRSLVFDLSIKQSATGTFVYKNHYANYLLLCLSIGIGYLVTTLASHASNTRERLRSFLSSLLASKAIVRIGLAIMVIALVMSRSRMGNTAFFASMTIVGILALFLTKRRSRGLTILIVSLFIIDTLIVSTWFGLDKVKERLETTSLNQETRDEVVLDSIPIIKDYLITGSGMGSFYSIYPSYQSDDVHLFYDHAHNDYLQFVIEAGTVASFIIFLVPLIVIKRCLRAMKNRRNSLIQGLAFGSLMATIGMLIHISVDFPLQAPANTSLFVIILALGLLTKKSNYKAAGKRGYNHYR